MSRFFEVPLLLAAAAFARLCDAEDGEELVLTTEWPVIFHKKNHPAIGVPHNPTWGTYKIHTVFMYSETGCSTQITDF